MIIRIIGYTFLQCESIKHFFMQEKLLNSQGYELAIRLTFDQIFQEAFKDEKYYLQYLA